MQEYIYFIITVLLIIISTAFIITEIWTARDNVIIEIRKNNDRQRNN